MKLQNFQRAAAGLFGLLAFLAMMGCGPKSEPAPEKNIVVAPPPIAPTPVPTPAPTPIPTPSPTPTPFVPTTATGPYHQVLALVIGNNSYSGMQVLRGAEADAEAMAEVLTKRFGFTVRKLIGSAATAEAIRNEIMAMRQAANAETDVIIYFAGHGIPYELPRGPKDPVAHTTGFAIPYSKLPLSGSSELATLREEAIDTQLLANDLMLWPARHRIVILDCCYSGLASVTGSSAVALDFDAARVDKPTVQIISAGLAGQTSVEDPDRNRGVFTMALVEVFEKNGLQQLFTAFMNISDKVVGSDEYQANASAGHPQLRLLSNSGGEFVLLPLNEQLKWDNYVRSSENRRMLSEAQSTTYGAPATNEDYKKALTRGDNGKVPELPPEEIKRHQARASVGDPISMAILTEYYGQKPDTASKGQAHAYAFESYSTGSPYGSFALGRAYEKGYGVPADPKLGSELQELSGLNDLIALFKLYKEVDNDIRGAKKGDVGSITRLASRGKGAVTWLTRPFSASSDKVVSNGLTDITAALAKGDVKKIGGKIADWEKRVKEIAPQTALQEKLSDQLLAELALLQQPAPSLSKQMQAYEEGMQRIQPIAVSLAGALKASALIMKGRHEVDAAVKKGNAASIAKELADWQKDLAKLKPQTPRQQELFASLNAEITTMLVPVSPVSKQLEAYETGLSKANPLSNDLADEMANLTEAKPSA